MTLIITTKINQTQIDMTDENLDLKALITEAASAAVANVVAPMQAEIKALKKQIAPEALGNAEMAAKRKEFRADAIALGVVAPENAEERAAWREAHGAEFSGELINPCEY